ncbi:MAG: PKD domain-containing protein [Bacteroidales bacterium]|nr:PKD domain-containing protein [Bacteroidales bacterium]MCF8457607.1 PKD domain-containing protein [Bacteroidales bacterium]
MKKTVFTLAVILWAATGICAQGPTFEWAGRIGGAGTDSGGNIHLDEDGNILFMGSFSGTVDFDVSPTSANSLTAWGTGNGKFLAKYTPSKELVWAKQHNGATSDGVVYGATGNVASWDESVKLSTAYGYGNMHWMDVDYSVSKIGSPGHSSWTQNICSHTIFGGPEPTLQGVGIDRNGNVYVASNCFDNITGATGYDIYELGSQNWGYSFAPNYWSASAFHFHFDYENNMYWFTDYGSERIYKFDTNHNLIWTKKHGNYKISFMATDSLQNIYLGGTFAGTTDFNPDTATTFYLSSSGNTDIFLSKLDSLGNFLWAKNIGNSQSETMYKMKCNGDGLVAIIAGFTGTVDFDPGPDTTQYTSNSSTDRIFLTFDPSGDLEKASFFDMPGIYAGKSVDMDFSGAIYFAGSFSGSYDFDPGTGNHSMTSAGSNDIFISKFTFIDTLKANFYASTVEEYPGGNIQFSNVSTGNPTSWLWDFGDGATDTLQNTNHVYQSPGTYSVSLIVSDSIKSDTLIKTDYITINPMQANFTVSSTNTINGELIQFTDLSTGYPTNWLWDFGDSTSLTIQNPQHIYTSPGTYSVTLIVSNSLSSDTITLIDFIFVNEVSALVSNAPNVDWMHCFGGTSWDEVNDIELDINGNVITTTTTRGKLYSNSNSVSVSSFYYGTYGSHKGLIINGYNGGFNCVSNFTPHVDLSGNIDESAEGGAITSNSNGKIFWTGKYSNVTEVDPGPGNMYYDFLTGPVIISEVNSSGNMQWVKTLDCSDVNWYHPGKVNSIVTDNYNNLVLSGNLGNGLDFDSGQGTYYLTGKSFVAKLDENGNYLWAKDFNSNSYNTGSTINSSCVDEDDFIYVTGSFNGIADFNPFYGSGSLTSCSGGASKDIFLSKFDGDGNFVWVKQIGGALNEYASDIDCDGSGNLYMTGAFRDTVDFDPGSGVYNLQSFGGTDIFVSKSDSGGNVLWAFSLGAQSDDAGYSLTVDKTGYFYLAGSFSGIVDFDPGQTGYPLTSNGGTDAFVAKYNLDGDLIWAFNIGGAGNDHASSLDADTFGNVCVTGNFEQTMNVESNSGMLNFTSHGDKDVFILKLYQNFRANFGTSASTIQIGETIQFSDITSGNPTHWLWDFGDGTTDTVQNPTHIYQDLGSYTVTFIAWNTQDTDTVSKQDFIKVEHLQAGFTASEVAVLVGSPIQFTDQSTGSPISWLWDFGDGTTDTIQNPSHLYAGPGSYSVSLIVSDGIYSDTALFPYYIEIIEPNIAMLEEPTFAWAIDFESPNFSWSEPNLLQVDNSGNIYIQGKLDGSLDLDPGQGTFNLTSTTGSNWFVVKLDSLKNFQWAVCLDFYTEYTDYVSSIEIDTAGNVYLFGGFYSTIDFDPGPGYNALTSNGDNDIFILKLDENGNYVWAKQIGGTDDDYGNEMCLDDAGNLYVTGGFSSTVDFDPGLGLYELTSQSGADGYVAKYSPNGDLIWVDQLRSEISYYFRRMDIDNNNNLYILGYSADNSTIVTASDTTILSFGASNFVCKIDLNGTVLWAKKTTMSNHNFGKIKADNSGNFFLTGQYIGPFDANPGPGTYILNSMGFYDIYVSKFDTQGNFLWANGIGTSSYNEVPNICVDNDGDVILSGYYYQNMDFYPGPGQYNPVNGGSMYICKYSHSGNLNWAISYPATSKSICVDNNNSVFSLGTYQGTVDFDPGNSVYNLTSGSSKIFLLKLSTHLEANFATSTTFAGVGDTIQFTDLSTGYVSDWLWDFGDGTTDSVQNPQHLYQTPGTYSVSLTISNYDQSDSISFQDYITIIQIQADFISSATQITLGDTIQFSDLTLGSPVNWLWDFGDGTTGALQNPVHVYQDTGTYTVSLIVSNSLYSDTVTKENYIQVINPLVYQNISLPSGWSIISTYIDPQISNLDSIFSPVISEIQIMKDENGATYWPAFNLNMIAQLTIGKAYQVKMLSQQSLTITGIQVDPANTNLNIPAGWSLLGYLRTTTGDISILMSSISSEIEIVKDGGGFVYWPSFNVNTIGNMVPGQGYQIKMNTQQSFTYPANSVNVKSATSTFPTTSRMLKNTGSNMTLGLRTDGLGAGQEILVYSQSGLLVGAGIVEGNFTAITLWGNDETTPEIDGLMDGEEFIVKLFDGEEYILEIDSWREGDGHYESNKIAIVGDSPNFQFLVSSFQLFQNIPNPFTHETEISFFLPVDCLVEFDIFNLLGKRIIIENTVQTLHATSPPVESTTFPKGKHTIHFNSKDLPAGTYFYRLKTPEFEQTRKMILLK